ncbi:MAG: hypothetical protein JRJ79_02680 [Deltaproteobacteria bacterium]|nr:hypothetical protein [Deltaproteobacteria bacterium]MBW1793009.1 hypothetical protein [Deltaproteobacteria bacterium]
MAIIKSFPESHIKEIGMALADAATHNELPDLFRQCGIVECGGNPKNGRE